MLHAAHSVFFNGYFGPCDQAICPMKMSHFQLRSFLLLVCRAIWSGLTAQYSTVLFCCLLLPSNLWFISLSFHPFSWCLHFRLPSPNYPFLSLPQIFVAASLRLPCHHPIVFISNFTVSCVQFSFSSRILASALQLIFFEHIVSSKDPWWPFDILLAPHLQDRYLCFRQWRTTVLSWLAENRLRLGGQL